MLLLLQSTSFFRGDAKVSGTGEHVGAIDAATSSDHDIHRSFDSVLCPLSMQYELVLSWVYNERVGDELTRGGLCRGAPRAWPREPGPALTRLATGIGAAHNKVTKQFWPT